MSERFVHTRIKGFDGMVRGFFTSRMVGQRPASAELFPGVSQVAISPKKFSDEQEALAWLERRAEGASGAVAVEVGHQNWLVGAWVRDPSS